MNKLSGAYIQGFREELEKIGLLGTALKWGWRLTNPTAMAAWLGGKVAKAGVKAGIKAVDIPVSAAAEAIGGSGAKKVVKGIHDVAGKATDYLL